MLRLISILLVHLALAGPAFGQVTEPELRAGDWVRVQTLAGERAEGALVRLDDARLQLELARGGGAFPPEDLQRLELSVGQDRRRGATIGGGIGLVVGVVFGVALAASGSGSGGASFAPIGGPFITVPLGAALGALAAPHQFRPVTVLPQAPAPGSRQP